MSTDQDSLNSNNNVANDLINTTGTNDVEQEEKNTGLPEDFTITAIKPTDHQHVKGSSKEESPYSLITTTETIDVQELNTDVNIHTNNIEKESPYEVLPRSSASLNKRIKISQLQRKRLKVDGNTNSMIVIGDSLIGFKDGIPGPFSQIKAVNRKCVKNEPVMNFKLRGDDHTNMPNRPPRKNRNRSSSQQTVKIYDKVFDDVIQKDDFGMNRRDSERPQHVVLASGDEQVIETGVRIYDPQKGRPERPSSTVVLPISLDDDLTDSAESWGSEFDETEEHDITEEEFYEVIGKPMGEVGVIDTSNYESLDSLGIKPPKSIPQPPLPPRESKVFQNLYVDLEKETYVEVDMEDEIQFPAQLPPLADDANDIQVKRYQIIKCIIENEKTYMKTLRRLIKEYEEPLYKRNIISHDRVKVIFKHIHEIIQCHQLFHMALSDRMSKWLTQDLIGDVLSASFSKSIVMKAYSSFIHNFSFAMDSIKETCKLVPAFLTFLKQRSGLYSYYYAIKETAKNHLNQHNTKQSLYDLMRQPLERIPQLVLLTQELTKITPITHADHFPLQMALTQLECLSETLSEKKRDSLLKHKVRQLDNYCTGLEKSLSSKTRYYVRHDDMLLCTIEDGQVVKTKLRRLFILNDLLICVSILTKPKKVKSLTYKKFKIKWCIPIHDVNVLDVGSGISVQSTNQTTTIRYSHVSSPRPGEENPAKHLEDLQHDIAVIGEIVGKVHALRGQYRFLDIKKVSSWYNDVKTLYERESELANMNWIELSLPVQNSADKRMRCLFNVHSPEKRIEWHAEFDNVKLRLTDNNNPGWFLQQDEVFDGESAVLRRTLPLLSNLLPLFVVENKHKVQCILEVSVETVSKPVLWIFSGNEHLGMITLMEMNMSSIPHVVESFVACQSRICCAERVVEEGVRSLDPYLPNVSIWVGTMAGRVLLFDPYIEDRYPLLSSTLKDAVISLKYCNQRVFAGLANGTLACFRRKVDGIWDVLNPTIVCLSTSSVMCMAQADENLWCGCGAKIFIIKASTLSIEKAIEMDSDGEEKRVVKNLVTYGVGVWVSMWRSSKLHLYHTETLDQLQTINIATPIIRMKSDIAGKIQDISHEKAYVTALMAKEGLLWVGTDQGLILTYPLPRLGGIPKVNGHACVSFHAHEGSVKCLNAFKVEKNPPKRIDKKKAHFKSQSSLDAYEQEQALESSSETVENPEWTYQPHYFVVEQEEVDEERKMLFKEDDPHPEQASTGEQGTLRNHPQHGDKDFDQDIIHRKRLKPPSDDEFSHEDEDYDQPKTKVEIDFSDTSADEYYDQPKTSGEGDPINAEANEDYDLPKVNGKFNQDSPTDMLDDTEAPENSNMQNVGFQSNAPVDSSTPNKADGKSQSMTDMRIAEAELQENEILSDVGVTTDRGGCSEETANLDRVLVDDVVDDDGVANVVDVDDVVDVGGVANVADEALPELPPKVKVTVTNFAESIEHPPKIPPKKNGASKGTGNDRVKSENDSQTPCSDRQFSYLDFTPEDSVWEREYTSDSGYELPFLQPCQPPPPGYAAVDKSGSVNPETMNVGAADENAVDESQQHPWEAVYDQYKALPLPNSPWHSIQSVKSTPRQGAPIDMRVYTPLTIQTSQSNHSLASSVSSGIGMKEYEKDISLGFQTNTHLKNEKESYYASLVTLSKREVATRKENLLKPWYVVSIGVGHVDLRKKSKKENKTLEFFRSLSMSANSSPPSNPKESILIAWKIAN